MQNDASGNEVRGVATMGGTNFVSWPGGIGAPTTIPTGPVSVGGMRQFNSMLGGSESEAYQSLRELKNELQALLKANEDGSIAQRNIFIRIKAGIDGVPNLPYFVNVLDKEIEEELKKENPDTKRRLKGLLEGLVDFTDELNKGARGGRRKTRRNRKNRKQTRKNRNRKSRRVNRQRK